VTEHDSFDAWTFDWLGRPLWSASCACGEQFGAPFKTIVEAMDAARPHYEQVAKDAG
jgi:hypothetical protein